MANVYILLRLLQEEKLQPEKNYGARHNIDAIKILVMLISVELCSARFLVDEAPLRHFIFLSFFFA